MGLFDFLFGRGKRSTPVDAHNEGPSPDYILAHVALRQMSLSKPMTFLALVSSENKFDFLQSIMDDISKDFGRRFTYRANAIQIHTLSAKGFPCAILEFPEPPNHADAHMIGLVVEFDPETMPMPEDVDDVPARYFTLEKSFDMSGQQRTVLGEWNGEQHVNFGDGPPVVADQFLAAIEQNT